MRDVNLKVEDGNLGAANTAGVGTQVKMMLGSNK